MINNIAKGKFLKLVGAEIECTFFKIKDSEEPEGIVRFRSGHSFYYSRNPMTPKWDLDHFCGHEIEDEKLIVQPSLGNIEGLKTLVELLNKTV